MVSTPVSDALGAAVDALSAASVDTPRLDAELLLAEATGRTRAQLAASPEAGLEPAAGRVFAEFVRRRLRREPIAYILGRCGFRRIELSVDRRVLIPRPESELLVELALEIKPCTVLDVGTGSGAIALAVAVSVAVDAALDDQILVTFVAAQLALWAGLLLTCLFDAPMDVKG